jgi:hypothetical protein
MTGSDDTLSKDGGPPAGAPGQRLDPHWLPFAVAVRRIELGLGLDEKNARQTVLQIGGKAVRILAREHPAPGSGILPAWVPGSDFYHADDLEDFIRDKRLRLDRVAGQNKQVPAALQPKLETQPPRHDPPEDLTTEKPAKADPAAAKPNRLPKKDFWAYVLGRCAARLAVEGTKNTQIAQVEGWMTELIENGGGKAEESTIRRYASELIAGFKEEL